MNYLPNEILLHIFKFLPLSGLGAVAQVSTTWRDLAYDDEVWDNAYTKRWGEEYVVPQSGESSGTLSTRSRYIGRYDPK